MSATIEDTLGKMLQLMESMNAMMQEQRNQRLAAKDEASAAAPGTPTHPTPTVRPIVGGFDKPGVSGDRATVVGMLSRIVEALKDVGLVPDKSDSEENKTSPFPKRRFGLNFNQAQRGNGASL